MDWQHHSITRQGVSLAVRQCGEGADKPVILLVHGYPDNSDVWERVAGHLADSFHVAAYDVRGAGASSAPRGLAAYRLAELSADLFAVIDFVSPQRPVHLVAHDWGSIQAWEAVTEPGAEKRIASFTSLSGPCLDHVGRSLRGASAGSLRQAAKSWYIAAFHLPLLAPMAWKFGLADAWPSWLARSEKLDRIPASATQEQDGVQGIALYRANMLPRLLHPRERRTLIPVQQLVALKDRYVGPPLMTLAEPWTDVLWRQELPTGHWGPLLACPDITAGHVREFIHRFGSSSS